MEVGAVPACPDDVEAVGRDESNASSSRVARDGPEPGLRVWVELGESR